MKEYFTEQLGNIKPLTAESIALLTEKDKSNGKDVEPGDRMLLCMVETITSVNSDESKNTNLELMRIYESELESFYTMYTFVRQSAAIPVFTLTITGKNEPDLDVPAPALQYATEGMTTIPDNNK